MTRKHILSALFVLVSVLSLMIPAYTRAAKRPPLTEGRLQIIDASGQPGAICPLKHTEVRAAISGSLARVTVTQQFHNPTGEKIEAVYLFPLPQNAAVDELTMTVGARTIRGVIREREEARRAYEEARAAGKVASLLDQERPNIFTQSVANILPGEAVAVTISYVETLKYEDGSYEFVFPMVVGERYNPDTVPEAEAARIAPATAPAGERPGHDISIEVAIDAGVPVEEIRSTLHEIVVDRNSLHSAVVRLREKDAIPNRDFILRFDVGGRSIEDALLTHRSERGGYFTLILQPPDRVSIEDVTPKELVFVLDTSGSMSGLPIETAKKAMKLALDGLYEQDTFNLITFSGDTHILFDHPVPATKENLRKAQEFLESRRGDGGTEMMKAIRAALADSEGQDHVRIVCFMTDGYVGNDQEIIAEVQKHPRARVFAFGIGNSVNRFLLDKMAEHGRGEVEYVPVRTASKGEADEAEAAAMRFHERVRSPLLTDIAIDWAGLPVTDVYPQRIPDLFSARPLVLSGRFTASGRGVIRLRGRRHGQSFVREIPVELPETQPQHDVLATLWARRRIDDLMSRDYNGLQQNNPRSEIKEAITRLGLEYRLMTPFTSFVAVEENPVTNGEPPQRIIVPVAQPDGVSFSTAGGAVSNAVVVTASVSQMTLATSVAEVVAVTGIENLPLAGRDFTELVQLAPGTVTPCLQTQPRRSAPEIVAGLPDSSLRFTVDGSDYSNDVTGGSLPLPAAAIQETRVVTNGATAEQGRSGPASVSLQTKAGTNQWHGSARFFGRSGRFSALPATFDRTQPKPSFHREQYAGTLGGPVWRDHIFVFGSFDDRQQQGLLQFAQRDAAAHAIRQRFAPAPLDELLGSLRADLHATARDQFSLLWSVARGENRSAAILQRTIGAATQTQQVRSESDAAHLGYTRTFTPTIVNEFRFGFNRFRNDNAPLSVGLQLNFPSLQDGAPFRVPALIRQNRWQMTDNLAHISGTHTLKYGAELQRVSAAYDAGFAARGLINFAEDFASADRNGDGRIDDDDLLFTVALRGLPVSAARPADRIGNTHFAVWAQDEWRIRPNLTLNYGLRWQFDTNEKNLSGPAQLSPLAQPFLHGRRTRDLNNLAPRLGFNWSADGDRLVIYGSYGIFYDRIPLQFAATERALDGRSLVIAAYAGNSAPEQNGQFFSAFTSPFAGRAITSPEMPGLNVPDPALQNPLVHQASIGVQRMITNDWSVRADLLHSFGRHFIIGREAGTVINPATATPDRVVVITSDAKASYDALLVSVEKRATARSQFRASYTLSKAFNFANGDQLPFFSGIADPNRLRLEYGPSPFDQRHRFTLAGDYELWRGLRAAALWTMASGVPMNILLPDGGARLPLLQRNAGGRLFHSGAELNRFIRQLNASGLSADPLPLVRDEARFNDSFHSFDLRLSKTFRFGNETRLEAGAEVFNLFNVTNILGLSNANYSGFANVLARDSSNPNEAGRLKSSSFGTPVTNAGGIFNAGGPRAVQFLIRFAF
ncbi:MAG TPA: TonB-dependent receptor [Blastocatellia bacterium]|nr:TonB-dependent receptor [Blastocatellia bacterium]